MDARHKERNMIKELAILLRTNGDRILSGESKLCLTTVSLTFLNAGFHDVCHDDREQSFEVVNSNFPREAHLDDLQFLYDFMQKTIALKIIHTSNCTLQGRASIDDFRCLKTLEIKKMPIHLLQGMQKLRPKLVNLICSRSLQNLQWVQPPLSNVYYEVTNKLFCMQHSQACLSLCNKRLTMVVEPIELYKDLFESCGGDMSTAMSWPEMKVACLSFNFLQCLDSSLRLLPKLEVLDLSHNNIHSTETYLEYLTEIERVNLSYNMLDRIPLFSISSRLKLKTLLLRGNNLDNLAGLEELSSLEELDVSFNCLVDHSVLQSLCTLNQLRFLHLGENPLSFHENHRLLTIQYISSVVAPKLILDGKQVSRSESMYMTSLTSSQEIRGVRRSSSMSSANVSSAYKFENSGEIATSLRTRKKKKSKSVRRKLVSDLANETYHSSRESSRASTPPQGLPDVEETRKQLELAREHEKEYWLHSINKQKALLDQSNETEDDIYMNEKEIALDSTEKEKIELTAEVHDTLTKTSSTNSADVTMTTSLQDELKEEDKATDEMEKIFASRQESDIWKTTMSRQLSTIDDNEEEIEDHFIVMLPQANNQQLIISVGKRFIHEKDITCKPVDMLDLSCLLTATTSEQKIVTDNTTVKIKMPVVHLTFDYVKKDRRERSYVMEDEQNLSRFLGLIQPALDAKTIAVTLRDRLQCLKCSREFSKSEAEVVIQEMSFMSKSSSLPRKYMGKKSDLKEAHICPFCKSTMVVAVDDEVVTTSKGSKANSPIGSFSSSTSSITPLATSSALSTPVKKQDKSEEIQHPILKSNHLEVKAASDLDSQGSGEFDGMQRVDTMQEIVYRRRSPAFSGQEEFRRSRQLSDESDISLLDSPSQASTVIESTDVVDGGDKKKGLSTLDHMSPVSEVPPSLETSPVHSSRLLNKSEEHPNGSLTTSTCSDMVRSVYENSLQTASSNHSLKGEAATNPNSAAVPCKTPLCRTDNQSVVKDSRQLVSNLENESVEPYRTAIFSIGTPGADYGDTDDDYMSFKSVDEISTSHVLDTASDVQPKVIEGTPKATSYLQDTIDKLAEESAGLPNELTSQVSFEDEPGKLKFSYEDFTQVDHRLKLHLVMTLFAEDEDVQCVLKCGVVQYMQVEEFVGILVISTKKIYLLKVTGQESIFGDKILRGQGNHMTEEWREIPPSCDCLALSGFYHRRCYDDQNLDEWLKCIDILPITDLQYIDIGFLYQSFRLEFDLEFSCYSFLVRDDVRCKNFVGLLTGIVQGMAFSEESNLQGISKSNDQTLLNIQTQILFTPKDNASVGEVDSRVIYYCMGYLRTSDVDEKGDPMTSPVSIVVTATDICLASENHQWPLPRLQATPAEEIMRTQFELKDRQKIMNVAQIETFPEKPVNVVLEFFNEDSNEEYTWALVMTTRNTVNRLIDSIKEPWQALFGVDLTIL